MHPGLRTYVTFSVSAPEVGAHPLSLALVGDGAVTVLEQRELLVTGGGAG